MALLSPVMVYATDWSVGTNSELSAKYSDNPRLDDSLQKSVWGRRLDVAMQLYGRSPLQEFRLQPELMVERFAGASDLNNDVVQLGIDGNRQWERTNTAVSLVWKKDTTLTSELEDTGYIQTTKDRVLKKAHPVLRYSWSERLESSIYGEYTDVGYRDAEYTGLADYSQKSMGVVMAYAWSRKDSLQTELYGTRFRAPRFHNQVTDTGIRASYDHDLYSHTKISITFGAHQVRSELALPGIGYQSVNKGFLGDVAFSQKRGTLSWKASLQRSVDPSGAGLLVQNDLLDIAISRRFNLYWQAQLRTQFRKNEALQSHLNFDQRRYSFISARLIRTLSPKWKLYVQYANQWQKYASADQGARENQFIASMSYDMAEKHLWP